MKQRHLRKLKLARAKYWIVIPENCTDSQWEIIFDRWMKAGFRTGLIKKH